MSDGSESAPQSPDPDAAFPQPEQAPAPGPDPATAITPSSGWRDRVSVLGVPLSRVQVIVGLTAGLLSISGFLYPALRASRAPLPLGEVVTVVHEASSRRPVTDATVEILTPAHVLVTTLTPRDEGRARHVIKEGTYRVRVTHPRFGLETRSIQVLAGTIAEIRFQLSPRSSRSGPSSSPAASPPSAPAPAPAAGRAAVRAPAPVPVPAPASRPSAAAVTAPKPASASQSAPVEGQGDAPGVRRTLLRDHQSP